MNSLKKHLYSNTVIKEIKNHVKLYKQFMVVRSVDNYQSAFCLYILDAKLFKIESNFNLIYGELCHENVTKKSKSI